MGYSCFLRSEISCGYCSLIPNALPASIFCSFQDPGFIFESGKVCHDCTGLFLVLRCVSCTGASVISITFSRKVDTATSVSSV